MQDLWPGVKMASFMKNLRNVLRLNADSPKKWRRVFLALTMGLLALFLRTYLAYSGTIEYDEPIYMDAALNYAQALHTGNLSRLGDVTYNIEHPALNKVLYGTLLLPAKPVQPGQVRMPPEVQIFTMTHFRKIFVMRMFSVFFGSLAVILLGWINPLAGFFLAIHTYAVKFTSVIYLEALPACMGLIAVISFSRFLRIFEETSSRSKKRIWLWLGLSSTALGVAAASKYLYATAGIAIVIYSLIVLLRKRKWAMLPMLLAWGVGALLVFVLTNPALWPNPVERLSESLLFSVNYSQNNEVVKALNYPVWQPFVWLLAAIPQQDQTTTPFFVQLSDFFIAVDPVIFLLALAGIPRLYRQKPLYLVWWVVGMVFLLVWKTKWPQYVLILLAPMCLSAALGVGQIRTVGQKVYAALWPEAEEA